MVAVVKGPAPSPPLAPKSAPSVTLTVVLMALSAKSNAVVVVTPRPSVTVTRLPASS